MMRVTHLRKTFSKLSETFVYDCVVEGKRLGVDPRVVCLKREAHESRPFDAVVTARLAPKGSLRRLRFEMVDGLFRSPTNGRRLVAAAVHDALAATEPDLVHAHFGPEGAIVAPWGRKTGVPFLVSHHGFDVSELLRDPSWLRTYRGMWDSAAFVTVVSEFQRRRLLDLGVDGDKLRVVRVGKRLGDFSFRAPRGPVRALLSIGRLAEKKGHDDAVRAVAAANEARPAADRFSLTIVGEGPQNDALLRLARETGLGDRLQLAGALPHGEVLDRLSKADAFLLCSKTSSRGDEEGVPTVLMEAQALGLPCVSTRHAGIPEAFDEREHRLLAPEGAPDEIAERLTLLGGMTDAELSEVAHRGRRHVERRFDLETETRRLVELYRLATAKKGAVS